jgi:class 3 adenylate cyclase
VNERNLTLEQWAGKSKLSLTCVFTDIVGSTRVARRLGGDDDWIPVVIKHFERARELKDKHDGYLIKVIGDACMVAFKSNIDAFNFATGFYIDTGDPDIRIREAIHFGRVWIIDNDMYGTMVNFTSRVQHSLEGKGIVISDSAVKDIRDVLGTSARKKGIRFEKREAQLKDFGAQTVWDVTTPEMALADESRMKHIRRPAPPSDAAPTLSTTLPPSTPRILPRFRKKEGE